MLMKTLLSVLAMAASAAGAQEFMPADRQTIPEPYRGTWALAARYCNDPGPAVVTIGERQIDFYERHGFLDLAQLNHAAEPAKFYGSFRFAQLLRFSTAVLRLEMIAGRLHITEGMNPDAPPNRMAWTRCPS